MNPNSLPAIPSQVKLSYNGNDFLLDIAEGNMISLNAIYEIAGSPENNQPYEWKRLPQTQELIDSLAKKLNVQKEDIIKTKRGKGGGTWAHWQLAVAYVTYLGGERVQIVLFESVRDLNAIINALNNFEIPSDILEACKDTLYVYAIREVDSGNIKLGISKDPQVRLKQLQVGNSSRLELIAYREAKNGYCDEHSVHDANNDYHIRGEWFSPKARLPN
ncbi:MAG: hypothetical protein BWK79_10930 [Beggiatoa sp. IS2]|nr:MAG: hypothetical protein BWK79_10930 [Beggiatoa sp. IS2]